MLFWHGAILGAFKNKWTKIETNGRIINIFQLIPKTYCKSITSAAHPYCCFQLFWLIRCIFSFLFCWRMACGFAQVAKVCTPKRVTLVKYSCAHTHTVQWRDLIKRNKKKDFVNVLYSCYKAEVFVQKQVRGLVVIKVPSDAYFLTIGEAYCLSQGRLLLISWIQMVKL